MKCHCCLVEFYYSRILLLVKVWRAMVYRGENVRSLEKTGANDNISSETLNTVISIHAMFVGTLVQFAIVVIVARNSCRITNIITKRNQLNCVLGDVIRQQLPQQFLRVTETLYFLINSIIFFIGYF